MRLPAHHVGTLSADRLLAPERRQTALVTLAVLLAHTGLLVWLQASASPLQPPQLPVVTMELLTSPEPVQASQPTPKPELRQPTPAASRPAPKPAPRPVPKQPSAAATPAEPSPVAVAAPSLATATTGTAASSAATAAPAAATSGPASPTPAAAKVELPSASADYLNNPKPAYPPLSRRLREEGKVVLRVLIETDGTAAKAEIRHSSGYERLDQAALQTVLKWRYMPAQRNGVPEAMWFNIPINFVLE